MSVDQFVRALGTYCVHRDKSIAEISQRYGWSREETLEMLQGKRRPNEEQIETIARELRLPVKFIVEMLDT